MTLQSGPAADRAARPPGEPLFARILCGIDGSPAAQEAARQAAVLAGGGTLELLSVTWTTGAGPTRMTALGEDRARHALESARTLAAEQQVRVSAELVHAADAAGTLLRQAAGHDLLALGARPGSRGGGIMLGSAASRAEHAAEAPVLIARRPPAGATFPDPILLATDGSRGSAAAAGLAARIAGRLGAAVLVLRVGTAEDVSELRAVARQTADVLEATGREPTVVEVGGHAADAIVEVAASERAALIVVGTRGHGGVRALGSVSERVAHRAPCSVLIARS